MRQGSLMAVTQLPVRYGTQRRRRAFNSVPYDPDPFDPKSPDFKALFATAHYRYNVSVYLPSQSAYRLYEVAEEKRIKPTDFARDTLQQYSNPEVHKTFPYRDSLRDIPTEEIDFYELVISQELIDSLNILAEERNQQRWQTFYEIMA